MSTQKVSVTLDELAVARARALVGPRGLSAYLDEALRQKLDDDERNRTFDDYLDALDEEHPSTPEEIRRGRERADAIIAKVRGVELGLDVEADQPRRVRRAG
jgi:hypothetical protein